MSTMTLKRLPSADWLAFGVALAAVFLKYLAPSLLGIIALVVFLPSILREVGVLKDTDEWARGIMHRAGFHAALVVVLFVTVNYVAVMSGGFATSDTRHWPLEVQFFRSAAMWVFVVSYVIQYWGAREGVFRILVVAGIMNLAPVVAVPAGTVVDETTVVTEEVVVCNTEGGVTVGSASSEQPANRATTSNTTAPIGMSTMP